jgi:hypothetical protein
VTLEARKLTVLPCRTYKLATAVSVFQPDDLTLLGHGSSLYVAYENERNDRLIEIQPTDDDEPTLRELSFPFTLHGVAFSPNQQLAIIWWPRGCFKVSPVGCSSTQFKLMICE